MKRLSIIPEIFIWLVFSVVAGFGYAFSFFEYIGGRAQLTATDIVIPTLVWLLLAAICTFLLRLAQKTRCFVNFSKYESLFLECSVLLLLLIGGWLFRFTEYFQGVWPLNPDNEFFQYAQVLQQTKVYLNPHPASRLYVGFLHIVFLLLGNIYEAGALTQFVLLLLGVFFWYPAIRKTFGPIVAIFFTAGAMLLPDSIVASMQYNPMMLLFAIYGFIAWVMASYARGKCSGFLAFVSEFFLGALLSVTILLDISGWVFIVICGLALRQHMKNRIKKSFVTPIACCLGIVLGEKAFTYAQSVIYGMSFQEAGNFLAYPNLTLQIPDLSNVQEFVFSLGTHPIFIVAIAAISTYWLINRRAASTRIMLGLLFLLAVQLLNLDTYLEHDFLIYMGILVLLGISIQHYLMFVDKQAVSCAKKACDMPQGVSDSEKPYRSTKQNVNINRENIREVNLATQDTTEIPDLSFISDTKINGTEQNSNTETEAAEPVVTVIHFEEQPAVTVPEKQQDRPVIFIPKSMEIPKRVSKPKVEFAVEVTEEKMHFDYDVAENADFDIS